MTSDGSFGGKARRLGVQAALLGKGEGAARRLPVGGARPLQVARDLQQVGPDGVGSVKLSQQRIVRDRGGELLQARAGAATAPELRRLVSDPFELAVRPAPVSQLSSVPELSRQE